MSMKSAHIFTGICIKRYPYLIKPLNNLETRLDEFYKKYEFEKSALNDFELKKLKEDQLQKKIMDASGKDKDEFKIDSDIVTTKEKIDTWSKNYQQLNYDLQSKIYSDKLQILIVNQKISKEDDHQWFLPIFKLENDFKSLKQHAESQVSSPDIQISKLPSYCYKYKHRTNEIKIFFLNAFVQRNTLITENVIRSNENIANTAWVTLDEVKNYVKNPKLLKVVHSFVKEF